jgi:hypothetical protein
MAFVDTILGDPFLNVTQRTGKTGAFDDLLFVQAMLKLMFTEATNLKRINPVKGPISVTGLPAKDTPLLIAAFQKHSLKRANPQGFVNRAVGSEDQKFRFTIVQMNLTCDMLLAALQFPGQIIDFLTLISPFPPPAKTTP